MTRFTKDNISQTLAFIAVDFSVAALVLNCVGLGTPRWSSAYITIVSRNSTKTDSINFFDACEIYENGTIYSCTNRDANLYHYPGYNASNPNPWMTDYNQHTQNAGTSRIVSVFGHLNHIHHGNY